MNTPDLKQRQNVIETLRQTLAEAEAGEIDGFFMAVFRPQGLTSRMRANPTDPDEITRIVGMIEQAKYDLQHKAVAYFHEVKK